jgi:hypothetical protein
MIQASALAKGYRIMDKARIWLADKLMVMAEELRSQPALVAAWGQLADHADDEGYTNEFRTECWRSLRDSVNQWYYDRPTTRDEVIDAFDFARQHDPHYQRTHDDLMAMLEDLDNDKLAESAGTDELVETDT